MKVCRISSEIISQCDPDDQTGRNNPLIKAAYNELFPKAKEIYLTRKQNEGYLLWVDGEFWYPDSKTEKWLNKWFAGKDVKPFHAGLRDLELPA